MTVRKRGLVMMMLVALLAGFAVSIASPAQASLYDGMRNRGTGLCIDNATEDFNKVQNWKCSVGHPAQQWIRLVHSATGRFIFINKNTGLCMELGAQQGNPANNSVLMTGCDLSFDSPLQTWTVFYAFNDGGWYQVWQNSVSFTCLTGTTGNGTFLHTSPCSKIATNQRWSFVEP